MKKKEKNLKKMSELLLNKEITLFAEDETIIYRNTTITCMWTEKGKRS